MVLVNYNPERLVRSQAAVRRCDVVITCTTFDSYYCCSLLLSSSLSSLLTTTDDDDDDDEDDVLYLYIFCADISGVNGQRETTDLCVEGNAPINCPTARNLVDYEDCTKYYFCSGSSLYRRSCSPGWKYHQHTLRCVNPKETRESCGACPFDLTNYRYKDYIVHETTIPTPTH